MCQMKNVLHENVKIVSIWCSITWAIPHFFHFMQFTKCAYSTHTSALWTTSQMLAFLMHFQCFRASSISKFIMIYLKALFFRLDDFYFYFHCLLRQLILLMKFFFIYFLSSIFPYRNHRNEWRTKRGKILVEISNSSRSSQLVKINKNSILNQSHPKFGLKKADIGSNAIRRPLECFNMTSTQNHLSLPNRNVNLGCCELFTLFVSVICWCFALMKFLCKNKTKFAGRSKWNRAEVNDIRFRRFFFFLLCTFLSLFSGSLFRTFLTINRHISFFLHWTER